MLDCSMRADRCCDTINDMTHIIKYAGFVNLHEENLKWPIGPWPKDTHLKEIGFLNCQHWKNGIEGWAIWLLSKFGTPYP